MLPFLFHSRLFLEWVLQQGESPGMGGGEDSSNHLVDHGKQQFARLARVRPQEFRDHFVSPNLIIDIFTNSMYSNKVRTAIMFISSCENGNKFLCCFRRRQRKSSVSS